jgi:hypothetical protein
MFSLASSKFYTPDKLYSKREGIFTNPKGPQWKKKLAHEARRKENLKKYGMSRKMFKALFKGQVI